MRVLHVINSLGGGGGAEQGLVREITNFTPEIESRVVTLYEDDTLFPPLATKGVLARTLELDSSHSGWNWPLGIRRLREVIEHFEPDVVHSSLASANLIAQLATRRRGVPVLSTLTLSGDPALMKTLQPGAGTRRAALLRGVSARAARSSHVWFRALTEDSKATTCAAMGISESRVFVLPRGVPPIVETSATRSSLGLPQSARILLNVGRQTAQKGHKYLIEAFRRVKSEIDTHLVILGQRGDGSRDLEDLIRLHDLEDSVTVVPFTPTPVDYYMTADVFVFTSLMEGLGTAVLEAMACGLPIVAFDIPPVREATRDGELAHLTPPGDLDAVATAVLKLISGQARDHVKEARTWVVENHSSSEIAHQLEGRLIELAENGSINL